MNRGIVLSAFALGTTGCVSTLTPPRTVPAGKTRAYLLVEGSRHQGHDHLAPRPMLRHGLTQRVDAGLQFALFMAGADVKWNAVATYSDSANASGGWDTAKNVLVGAPVLLGFNVARHFSLIAVGGSNMVWREGELPHVLYRAGAGVNWHSRFRFAMQLEIDALYDVPRGAGAERPAPLFIGGLGFVFGHESEYDDVDGQSRR